MTAIEFENISKQYRLGLVSTGTLSHDLNRFWQTKVLRREDPYLKVGEVNDRAHKGDSEYVWALKDINFKVEQGDVVGIIGRNGAGKSTLLKLLSRVTAPTTGTIRARGRIASLLEVGTGFHPEMTGRENIYMNGAIMGMSRAEITRKLDEIVDFSGCERYLDTPVKRYSSGMTVRLGFAIAAHLEPEILVVDEVLAVGDAEFQKKAIGKIQDVSRGEGRTVLFVSHNMDSIQRLCTKGIALDSGQIKYQGNTNQAIELYLSQNNYCSEFNGTDGDPKVLYLNKACIRNKNHNQNFFVDSIIIIEADFTIKRNIGSLVAGFNICNNFGTPIARCDYNEDSQESSLKPGSYHIEFEIPAFTLAAGDYKIKFDIAERNVKCYTTDLSELDFTIHQGSNHFGNPFDEEGSIKRSLFHCKWLKLCQLISKY
ncbi:lipopolysaccharide transport system ATP-binding protein [Fibrobacter sp. UWT2]|uniref:ABC transporter ATP-binding protein n=1 Tax=Fibrobacter sp. UWT2 TaxID=1896224 RepID=UPI000922868B|nr:ABC transporter ATP-binding protein [Fibrobacter sp. UWT2]SHL56472.1 lipopolysaccharide transport system ATP-binding protein [Fibrobacter sp. UWT2]